ncbi:MAG: diaminopimelate epimerase [Endomicrobia bacterium]|nr:diaminopimelate epimerase [Endomicrobiia bacterium]MDW8055090.1 diaminopimelate epimerase [Elusimicrobiota bacterium]
MKKLNFAKFVAAGNDFVIINNFDKKISSKKYPELARKLCQQKFAIGADGFLVIEPSLRKDCEFKMVYYNSDGSFATMCGNGARCIAFYAYELELCEEIVNFETAVGVVNCMIKKNNIVSLKLPEPKLWKINININLTNGKELNADFINTGVPHTVIFVDDLDKVDVYNIGKEIRNHKMFIPDGTNVDFVKVKDQHSLYVRTYERGIEGETLSCGTGVVASAIISALRNFVKPPVKCFTRSGEVLTIRFTVNPPEDMISPVSNLYLEGKVRHVFDGEFYL